MMATPAPIPDTRTPRREMSLPELVEELGQIRAGYEALTRPPRRQEREPAPS